MTTGQPSSLLIQAFREDLDRWIFQLTNLLESLHRIDIMNNPKNNNQLELLMVQIENLITNCRKEKLLKYSNIGPIVSQKYKQISRKYQELCLKVHVFKHKIELEDPSDSARIPPPPQLRHSKTNPEEANISSEQQPYKDSMTLKEEASSLVKNHKKPSRHKSNSKHSSGFKMHTESPLFQKYSVNYLEEYYPTSPSSVNRLPLSPNRKRYMDDTFNTKVSRDHNRSSKSLPLQQKHEHMFTESQHYKNSEDYRNKWLSSVLKTSKLKKKFSGTPKFHQSSHFLSFKKAQYEEGVFYATLKKQEQEDLEEERGGREELRKLHKSVEKIKKKMAKLQKEVSYHNHKEMSKDVSRLRANNQKMEMTVQLIGESNQEIIQNILGVKKEINKIKKSMKRAVGDKWQENRQQQK